MYPHCQVLECRSLNVPATRDPASFEEVISLVTK
jgi:hypothetical protein